MNYQESREYIDKITREIPSVLGLDHMRELMKRLGNPQDDLKYVHIAGTNGKGSVIAFLYSVLSGAGYRIGRYVSPTLYSYRGRMEVSGSRISREDFAAYITQVSDVGALREGYVLDHIKAGKAMTIYHDLKLDKLDCTVAIIKNARSNKMGKKDIIKVECPVENLDLDILGFIDHNITVNVIKDEKIVAKKELKLPNQVVNVIKCKNPRCITSIEQGLDQIFVLADKEKEVYRCKYCEEKYTGKRNK